MIVRLPIECEKSTQEWACVFYPLRTSRILKKKYRMSVHAYRLSFAPVRGEIYRR